MPTARIGLPAPPHPLPHAGMFSMGRSPIWDSLTQLTKALIATAVDTCCRTTGEVGLSG